MLDRRETAKNSDAGMELRQLRYFLEVADLKSFSRAAATLGIAQPALSRHVRMLEKELGTELFYRDGRGASLTSVGKQYYEKVRTILHQLEEARTEVQAAKDIPTGEVVLGVPPQLGAVLVVQLIKRFGDRFPNVRIRISEGFSYQIAERLSAGRLDLGFVYDPYVYRYLSSVMMIEEALYLVGPAGNPITAGPDVPFRDIAPCPLVMPDLPSTLRTRVAEVAAQLDVTLHWTIEVDSIPAIKQLVMDGAGFTILPRAAIYDEIKRGLLSAAPIVDPVVSRPLGVVVPVKGAVSVATRKLIQIIGEEVRGLIANGTWSGRVVDRTAPTADKP
jgi:LysR family nitrogen assimilation transcriptional regulator